jgi:2OG-Fe(II) oxygenase superfamily
MARLELVAQPLHAFPHGKWSPVLPLLCDEYRTSQPSPHICLADFLEEEAARAIARDFPTPAAPAWTHYKHQNENKLGMTKRTLLPVVLGKVVDELNSPEFVNWITELTGISGLVSDPTLDGGGLHQAGQGGFLNLHADFTAHHYQKNWRRRVNLILYLTPCWREEWGGALEFWDSQTRNCVAKYPSLFNHAVIFNTDDRSLHGFPDPLRCPERATRNSLALYYYTVEEGPKLAARSTDYRARPLDSRKKAALIWLDKHAVHIYSRIKQRFGFSDDFVSWILGYASKKR